MKLPALALVAASCLAPFASHAQEAATPPAALHLDGVPPVPAAIIAAIQPYAEFRAHTLFSWHPTRREMLVGRRLEATTQVHLVTEPGAKPVPLTSFPNAVAGALYQPRDGDYFLFAMGEGGNEVFRINRYDPATKTSTPLSPEGERAGAASWNRAGDRVVFTTSKIDRNSTDRTARTTVHLMDPMKPEGDRVLAELEGGGWGSFKFSQDGRQLVFEEYLSANESHLWLMDVASGKKRRITPARKGGTVAWRDPEFSRDGKGVFATTDAGSEFRRLVYLPLNGGKPRILTAHLEYDVEGMEVSFDANMIAFITNERGSHVLRLMDLRTLKELPRPALFDGVISGLKWRDGSTELGFSISSARASGDIFSYDVKQNRVVRWTNGNNPAVNTSEFAEPRPVKWKSFDGREISGFHYHPGSKFSGKRPVIINIHGGPESQARPNFLNRNNYYINELGVAMIYPNVRGSTGFGKTFLKLDNGMKREDSVKDIGALLDWIAQQPDLDPQRVLIMGGSYGGYMTLACAVHFADRIAGAVSVVGISNFVTFLERTETYRRDLRRVEYGDERDPAMRAHLESISPLNHVEKIIKPLFVIQGRNDPRVPYTEAEQIVASLKQRNVPVWFMMAGDEGHGFVKKPNADYQFGAMVEFARQTLLK